MTKPLTSADNGATINVHPGDPVIIRLPENPTTGYIWQLDLLDGPLEPIADSYTISSPASIGGGGIHEFRFCATVAGTAHLTLKHGRPWEGDASITDRFSATIVVAT